MTKRTGQEPPDKQKEIAHGCSLTVVAESTPYLHRGNVIANAARSLFQGQIGDGKPVRYDLLAWPSSVLVRDRAETFGLLLDGIKTAVDLHQAERLLTIGADPALSGLAFALPDVEVLRLAISSFTYSKQAITPSPPPFAAILTCMDWRLHGPGRLVAACETAFGFRQPPAILTLPGAAKLLADGGPNADIVMLLVAALIDDGIEYLYLVQHRDCGKYGGDAAFASEAEQASKLLADMRLAKRRINSGLPGLKVRFGIANLHDDRVERVVAVE